jgi:hypothetical protein
MIFGKPTPHPGEKKPANLAEWLDLATEDLIPPAQARIRKEIEAHYADALQAGLKRGLPEFEALAAALADLGNAEAAGRRFRREHPSTSDPDTLALVAWLQMFFGILLTIALITFHFFPEPNPTPGPLGMFFFLSFCFIVVPALGISLKTLLMRSRQALTPRPIFMLVFINWLNLAAYFILDFINSSDHESLFKHLRDSLGFIWMATIGSSVLLRLRKKLASAREDNLPPPPPTAHL